nr:condensation domain-containing protein [Aestuariivita boseongensis]
MQRLPLSSWQQRMAVTCSDPETSDVFQDRNLIRFAQLITPSADLRRARRAFDKLVARHDTLRLRMVEESGSWHAVIPDTHPTGLVVEEIGDVSDAEFDRILQARAKAPMPITSDALFQIILMRFGARGDVVLMRAHHAIIDGFGAILLGEELFKLLLNMPILQRPVSHADYVQYVERQLRREAPEAQAFWERELLPMAPPPDLGRHAKGLPTVPGPQVARTIGLSGVLDSVEFADLAERAGRAGVTPFSVLYAGFGDVLCQAAGEEELILCSVSGRLDPALRNFVGAAMWLMPLNYRGARGKALKDNALRVQDKIRTAAAFLPSKAMMGPNGAVHRAFEQAGRQRLQFFVHIPEAQGRMKSSDLAKLLSASRHGEMSFGHIRVRKLDLEPQAHTDAELQLSLEESPDGPMVSFGADAASFSEFELNDLKNALRERLEEL